MENKLPWEVSPGFRRERLILLGRRLLEIRTHAVKAQLPIKGETTWVLGVRVYEWTRLQLADDAVTGRFDWLTAVPLPNHQFDLRIGGVPIQYFRGSAE